jgi:hypothetical protein
MQQRCLPSAARLQAGARSVWWQESIKKGGKQKGAHRGGRRIAMNGVHAADDACPKISDERKSCMQRNFFW